MLDPMNHYEPIGILAANLKALMEANKLTSGYDVERRTGVSKAAVNNILAGRHAATIETVAKLAQGFRVPAWSLLYPGGLALAEIPGMALLMESYSDSDTEGRQVILRVAESQAKFERG